MPQAGAGQSKLVSKDHGECRTQPGTSHQALLVSDQECQNNHTMYAGKSSGHACRHDIWEASDIIGSKVSAPNNNSPR